MDQNSVSSVDFVTFALIIDDIVFPDGQTAMETLGGGGPQTAFGMRLWAERVGLVAGVGTDLPPLVLQSLQKLGLDINGLRYSDELPTLRAWQLLEQDGRRTQVWRVPKNVIDVQLKRSIDLLPAVYQQPRGVHLGIHPEEPDINFIRALRDRGVTVSVEPFRPALSRLSDWQVRRLVSAGQIFSPNIREAESLVGQGSPEELVRRLGDAGAQVVALRQGPDGALLYVAGFGQPLFMPAVKTRAVDPTGAGNAFCGGFLVGWVQSGDLRTAGAYGSVAASFLVEQQGVPPILPDLYAQAQARLQTLLK
jgi:sugar/nucleoside kinase (ribokinase family)